MAGLTLVAVAALLTAFGGSSTPLLDPPVRIDVAGPATASTPHPMPLTSRGADPETRVEPTSRTGLLPLVTTTPVAEPTTITSATGMTEPSTIEPATGVAASRPGAVGESGEPPQSSHPAAIPAAASGGMATAAGNGATAAATTAPVAAALPTAADRP